MSDFDITSINSKSSFVASLKKRKAFGLLDSDSEEEETKKRQQKRKASSPSLTDNISISSSDSEETKDVEEQPNQEPAEEKPTTQPNPYLPKEIDLDLIQVLASSPATSNHSDRQQTPTTDLPNDDDSLTIKDAFIENLDPELEALLNTTPTQRSNEPQKITIKLQYVHTLSNLSERAKSIVEKLIKPMKLIIMDNTQFDKILDVFCSHKKLKKSDVVLVYNDDTVFLTGTPAGIGMNATTPNIMKIYPKSSYDSYLKEKEQQKQERLKKWAEHNNEDDLLEPETKEDVTEDDKLLIVLRSNDHQETRLRVKRESTIESVIAKYKEIRGLSNRVNLSFEGEVLDPESTIGDADMEDEDLIEVIISN